MPELLLFTWNTQGNFREKTKFAEITELFSDKFAVGFIQEGGNVDTAGEPWYLVPGNAVGAYNERCTNYLLMNKAFQKKPDAQGDIANKKDALVIAGGEAGRTAPFAGVGKVLFVSWHSEASPKNQDTAELIRTVDDAYGEKYDLVVIGGDFNAWPKEIAELIDRSALYLKNFPVRAVASSGGLTHPGSEKELDFFVIMSKQDFSWKAEMKAVDPSDHHAVALRLKW